MPKGLIREGIIITIIIITTTAIRQFTECAAGNIESINKKAAGV
jgi:hypothetical protein